MADYYLEKHFQAIVLIYQLITNPLRSFTPSVVSNSTHQEMQITLGATKLFSYCEGKRFSVEDVARGKP